MSDERQKQTHEKIPVAGQPRDRLYEMSLRFVGDAGIRSIDDILSQCFPGEGVPRLKDAVTVRMHQVVPFIPDDDMLREYARVIAEAHSAGSNVLDNVRFDGYDYLYAVQPAAGTQGDADNTDRKEA